MQKIVTLSFDDGVTQDRKLISLLKKYGLKCTFNLNSKLLGSEGALSKIAPGDVKEVYAGFEVASHSCTHPYIPHSRLLRDSTSATGRTSRRSSNALARRAIRMRGAFSSAITTSSIIRW